MRPIFPTALTGADIDSLEIFTDKGQSSVRSEVVGHFFEINLVMFELAFWTNRVCGLSR
jgi:hypothetical protein